MPVPHPMSISDAAPAGSNASMRAQVMSRMRWMSRLLPWGPS